MPGELPLVLLALLAERPQGGYELQAELARRFAPNYRPSPGSVYPALAALRTERLVEQTSGKKAAEYRATKQGRRLLAEKGDLLARIEARTSAADSGASLEPALTRFVTHVRTLSGRADRAAIERILDGAAKKIADLEVPK
jgi:DNA-binding PadR family transcriptional regulator